MGSGIPDIFEKPYDCDRISHCLFLFRKLRNRMAGNTGTLNIAPQGNFIVNIHSDHAKSETDEFDVLIRDANFDV